MTFSGFPDDSPYVSENQAARILGVPRGTLRNRRVGGFLPDWIFGPRLPGEKGAVAYVRSAIEQVAEEGGLETVTVGFYQEELVTHPVREPADEEPPASDEDAGGGDPRERIVGSIQEGVD